MRFKAREGAARARGRAGRWHGRLGLALVALVIVGGGAVSACGDAEPRRFEEPFGQSGQAIWNGSEDTAGHFRAVGLFRINGGCTAFLIAPRVALTAAHCLGSEVARGCATHGYQQPAQPGGAPVDWEVRFPAPGSNETRLDGPTCVAAGSCEGYGVDSYMVLSETYPVNWYDCCAGTDAATCWACNPPLSGLYMFDLALVHLDREVEGIEPLRILLRPDLLPDEPPDPAHGIFEVDPLSWIGNDTVVHVAGVGSTDNTMATYGVRRWGPTTLSALGHSGTYPTECAFATAAYSCDACYFTLDSSAAVLDGGGADHRHGDSGSPLIVNDTELGASRIEGLPTTASGAYGEPVAVAVQRQLLWNASFDVDLGGSEPETVWTHTGSWIRDRLDDWDSDGVPDTRDNCVVAPNPDQGNCNADAEHARGYPEAGDACDPIPCATAEILTTERVTHRLENEFVVQIAGRRISDRLDLEPHGSSSVGNGAQPGRPVPEVAIPNVPTHYRFCEKVPATIQCDPTSIRDDYLHALPPEGVPRTIDTPYLPANLERLVPAVADTPQTVEALDHDFGAGGEPRQRRWLYEADAAEWVGHGWITDESSCPPPPSYGCGTNLDGRFWVKSDTNAGRYPTLQHPEYAVPSPVVSGGTTGYRVNNAGLADGAGLANHYVFLAPDPLFGANLLTKPARYVWFKWMLWVDPGDPLRNDGYDGRTGEDSVLVSNEWGELGLLRRDGMSARLDAEVGPNLRELLAAGGLVWRSAAEPRLNIGREPPAAGFHALAFAADGTDVIEGVAREGLLIGTTADLRGASPSRPGSPASREGFVAVFSRSEDAAFVVGGRGLASGQELGDVWMRRVRAPGEWTEVPLDAGLALGTVLAATWSFRDRKLWVLDETEGPPGFALDAEGQVALCHGSGGRQEEHRTLRVGLAAAGAHLSHGDSLGPCAADLVGKRVARLLRIDPYTGSVEPVGFWPRQGSFDRHWLVVDQDGSVLLVATATTGQHHAIARFAVSPYRSIGAVELTALLHRPGRLAAEPIVDGRGYGFVLDRSTGLELVRIEGLAATRASLSAAGGLL